MADIPEDFVAWVARIIAAENFAARERNPKLEASRKFNELLEQGLSDAAILDWLRRSARTVDWRTTAKLTDAPPDQLRQATERLLENGDLGTRLDAFGRWLRAATELAEGEQTAVASSILMGLDAVEFPPHRTRILSRALGFAGQDGPSGPPSHRYLAFLDFCDEVAGRIRSQGLGNPDRLDVQGACWVIGGWDLADISKLLPDDYDAFERWQSNATAEDVVTTKRSLPAPTWWVNQGATYRHERDGGYIWAPQTNKAGVAMGHHTAVSRVSAGDVIVHYADGQIRAIGTALSNGHEADRPSELPGDAWGVPGLRADVEYRELATPIPLEAIDAEIRQSAGGPFTSVGSVKQGYLFELPTKVGELIARIINGASEPQSEMVGVNDSELDDLAPLSDVADAFIAATTEAGLQFGARHQTLLRSFVSALATKRFVIFTGLSGSGKTRLAQAFGHWLGALKVVAVRPDWTSPDSLLGFENALSEPLDGRHSWNVPDTLRFILEAHDNPTQPHLLLLDEMNLAHVERYFADVLSGMESGEPVIPNLVRGEDGAYRWNPDSPEALPLPPNLFIVGTVNIDETTYMFSPKVLDRANTFEFRVETSDLVTTAPPAQLPPAEHRLARGFLELAKRPRDTAENDFATWFRQVHAILAESDREFGHRTFQEALRFADLLAAAGEGDPLVALDLQVAQKVLPRLHGNRRELGRLLDRLGGFCFFGPTQSAPEAFSCASQAPSDEAVLPISYSKLHRMAKKLQSNHFVSFAE